MEEIDNNKLEIYFDIVEGFLKDQKISKDRFEKKLEDKPKVINKSNLVELTKDLNKYICIHKNVIYDKDHGDICIDCGIIFSNISFSAEKFNKNSNSERCKNSLKSKNLEKEINIFNLDNNIVKEIIEYFDYITENKICRAKNRKRILFACIYNVCIKNNIFINPLNYCNNLKLKAKDMSKGLSIFNSIIRINNDHYFLVIKFIINLLDIFCIDKIHHKTVIIIYNNIKYEKILSVCRSHSIATGLLYYYICLAKLNISKKKFEFIVKYSKTYLRIAKIINKIFELDIKITNN